MKRIERVSLSHGSGGEPSWRLISELFLKEFYNPFLSPLTDSAILNIYPSPNLTPTLSQRERERGARGEEAIGEKSIKIAFTTDSYVVKPLFFPGGDIGKLSIAGTVNDLSVMGARPLFLSCGLIIEEGFEYSTLEKIILSMKKTASDSGVQIVTGDTKVVERGAADKIFISTAGVGIVMDGVELKRERIMVGDIIIISGSIGDHGISVISKREGIEFESEIESDCAPLNGLIIEVLESGADIKFMRDPTRGGLAAALNEFAKGMNWGILLNEKEIPIKESVRSVSDILGFDPLYIANEGKVVMIVSSADKDRVLKIIQNHPLGRDARIIGEIVSSPKEMVTLKTVVGGTRIVDMPSGEQLPRIC
ncbi:MAG: hydrogenase expression/formation protein HypE [Nitrospinae bacterium]|nr:hydrogenase expression/formation protein HypE [Nitrospinota bacterium]